MKLPQILGYDLVNDEKADRALNGTLKGNGERFGGVVKADGTWDDAALLAEYDKLGGLITKNGDKVVSGSFYDFKNKVAREVPEVKFVFNVNGKFVEVPAGVELPGEVKAVQILAKAEEEKPRKRKK